MIELIVLDNSVWVFYNRVQSFAVARSQSMGDVTLPTARPGKYFNYFWKFQVSALDWAQNRVDGGLTAPASHTTVHAVRHTAVREKLTKR